MTRFLPLLLLAACTGDDDKTETCDTTVDATFPEAGGEAFYRDPVSFTLSAADPTATITTDIPGTQVVSEDGLTVTWVPSEPLAPSTPYTVTLTWCGGEQALDFTTSSLGTPLADPQVLVGKVYTLDLPHAHIVQPPNMEGILGPMLAVVLAEVVSVSESELDVLGAVAVTNSSPPVEDYCTPTIDFPPGAFEQPFFHLGPADVDLVVSGVIVTVNDLEITGTFSSDATFFGGGVFSGLVDTRPLSLVQNPEGDGSDLCTLLGGLGVECEVCPSDGEAFCLSLLADGITANEQGGADVVEVLGYNCEGCADGPPEPEATCEG